MKTKKIVILISLVIFLAAGIWAVVYAYGNIPITYDGSDVNVVDLYNDPDNYDVSDPDGVASIIVQENLSKTGAVNNVAAVVFDFRGYDTLGEAFILITAIAGSFVILSVHKNKKKAKAAACSAACGDTCEEVCADSPENSGEISAAISADNGTSQKDAKEQEEKSHASAAPDNSGEISADISADNGTSQKDVKELEEKSHAPAANEITEKEDEA